MQRNALRTLPKGSEKKGPRILECCRAKKLKRGAGGRGFGSTKDASGGGA